MAVEADPEQVPRLPLVPVRRRPDADDAWHGLAVVDPDLEAHACRPLPQRKQVVADGEAARLRPRQALEALRRRLVQVAPSGRADVTRDALAGPAEVVGGGDVGEEVEGEIVAEVAPRLRQARRVDDKRRLALGLTNLDEPGTAVVVQLATPRSSYAGGTPAITFSCRRTMPSISASGRCGQPGTWMSTATILTTPCSVV